MNNRSLEHIASSSAADRAWRSTLLLAIIVLHLLLLLQLSRRSLGERAERPMTLSVFTIPLPGSSRAPAPAKPKRVPPPPKPTPAAIAPRLLVAVDPAPPSLVDGDVANPAPRTGDGACELDLVVRQAIGQDAAAMHEIEALPSDIRTPADAILLWNGGWQDSGSTSADTSSGSLRQAVERAIAGASPDCRDVASTGPHFIAVPAGSRTMMIVIGSGTWRWADLMAPAVDCLPASAIACSQNRIVTKAARMASP